jgi:8-oxo-dGTP pyrophosphatase MutT (NUDIX family)
MALDWFRVEPKQVFGEDVAGNSSQPRIAYCPECGAAMGQREEGGEIRSACTACEYVHFANPSPAAAVLVVDEGRVLLGRRKQGAGAGRWCIPCGFIEYHEDFLTAALREVEEETGVTVELTGLLDVYTNFLTEGNTLVVVLLGHRLSGEPRPSEDMSEVQWFHPEALPEMAFEADKHVIATYFSVRGESLPVDERYTRLKKDA